MQCHMCGSELTGLQRKWCSKRCKNRWRRTVPTRELVCAGCGTVVLVPPARLYKRTYCSQHCGASHYNSVYLRGPRNGRWRGGKVLSYGADWKRVKQEVRERDKVCRSCGKTPEQNGRALDVHHIDPYRFTGDHSLDNLLALCRSCHMRADDHGRRGSPRFAGPQQLELRPLSQKEIRRQRGEQRRRKRRLLQDRARALSSADRSLRQIGRSLGVSHQTVANWLASPGAPEHAGIVGGVALRGPGSSVGRALG